MIVVIGIILLLSALLLPVLSMGRQAAHDSRTLQYANQIGKASLLYATDHDDFFPYATSEWALQRRADNEVAYTPERDAMLPENGLLEVLETYTSLSIFYPWSVPNIDADFVALVNRDPSPFYYYRDDFIIDELTLGSVADPSKESLVMELERDKTAVPDLEIAKSSELLSCLKVDTSVKRLTRFECWNSDYIITSSKPRLQRPRPQPSYTGR